jgi:hypothetical protein
MKKYILTIALFFSLASSGWCTDITVGPGGEDYTTIKLAIAAASDDDTIIITDGTYTDDLTVDKNLTFESATPNSTSVITQGDGAAGFYFVNITATGLVTFNNIKFYYESDHENGVGLNGAGATIVFNTCVFDVAFEVLSGFELGVAVGSVTLNDCTIEVKANLKRNIAGRQNQFVRVPISTPTDFAFNRCAITFGGAIYGGLIKMEADAVATVNNCTITFDTIVQFTGFLWMQNGTLNAIGGNVWDITDVANQGSAIILGNNSTTSARRGYLIDENTITSLSTAEHFIINDETEMEGETGSKIVSNNKIYFSNPLGHVILIGGEGAATRRTYSDGAIIEKNYIEYIGNLSADPNRVHGILFGNSNNGIIRYNYLKNVAAPILVRGGLVANGWVYSNIIINPNSPTAQALTLKGVDWVYVSNNTIYGSPTSETDTGITLSHNGAKVSSNVVLKNNIMYIENDSELTTLIDVLVGSHVGFESDNNLFYGVDDVATGNYFVFNGAAAENLSTWQARGLDVNSLTTDPLFLDTINCIPCSESPLLTNFDSSAQPTTMKQLSPISRYEDMQIFTIDKNTNAGAVKYIGNDGLR